MNPVNNGLQFPIVGDRHRGMTRPVGNMSLNSLTKPVGRMGLNSSPFKGFSSLNDMIPPLLIKCPAGQIKCKNTNKCYDPKVNYVQDPCRTTSSFVSSLPAHGSTWSGKGWASADGVKPIVQARQPLGFVSSLPAQGTTWQGKGWASADGVTPLVQPRERLGFVSSLPAKSTTWSGKGWA